MDHRNPSRTVPTTLVVFGATGDLMARKILPALFRLFEQEQLPPFFSVTGFSRRRMTHDAFRAHAAEALRAHADIADPSRLTAFLRLLTYRQGRFERKADYAALAKTMGMVRGEWRTCTSRLFYLAAPPVQYEEVLRNLARSGLTKSCAPDEGFTRIIVEKPFGTDRAHAEHLDRLLAGIFQDEQVYRIDHYLAKEALQNILAFRFSNNLLERAWDAGSIERVDVKLLETIDVEGRGAFYDAVGALLDVGQNHLLQMLALMTMEHPRDLSPQAIRQKRAEVLERLRIMDARQVRRRTMRGQYDGYRSERDVASNSTTETYFRAIAFLDTPRWRGVPFVLESGKKMPKLQKEIIVTFRHPAPCLCPAGREAHYTNTLHFRTQPDPGIEIRFWAKKPGFATELESKTLAFRYDGNGSGRRYLDEYARLLLDALNGDQTLFVSSRETLAGWRFIDSIVREWRTGSVSLQRYGAETGVAVPQPPDRETGLRKELLLVGLGKMGSGMALRLLEKGWRVVAFDPHAAPVPEAERDKGFLRAESPAHAVALLAPPRVVWLMVPHATVEDVLRDIVPHLKRGDTVIDGGNSHFAESARRAKSLSRKGIRFVDVGMSGGPEGARYGAALMVGGAQKSFEELEPLFRDLARVNGHQFFEGAGAGHFVKMVHNAIEYGMMQAIAEGFSVLKKSPYRLSLADAARIYNSGSVIESRLLQLLEQALEAHGESFRGVSGSVAHTGEAEWTVRAARARGLKIDAIEQALRFRVRSTKHPSYTGRILSALRAQFGGHSVRAPRRARKRP